MNRRTKTRRLAGLTPRKMSFRTMRFLRRHAEEIRESVPDLTPAQENRRRSVLVRFELPITTTRGDSLLVLADALLGDLIRAVEAHGVKVPSWGKRAWVNGKPVYDRKGKVREGVWL